MNWPAIEDVLTDEMRSLKVEYITRKTELIVDTKKCTTCMQCVKVCPKAALAQPQLQRGVKVSKKERLPEVVKPVRCVFCGTCMVFCPYGAITMKLDGKVLSNEDLTLVKKKIIPRFQVVKLGKVELKEPGSTSAFFERAMAKITKKSDQAVTIVSS
jgi:4Fe-4S ferredoxin